MPEMTDDQDQALLTINLVLSVVSFLGSTFTISCYIKCHNLRSFAFTLVLHMAVGTLMSSVGYIVGGFSTGAVCAFFGAWISFWELGALVWAFLIAFVLHQAFLAENVTFKAGTVEKYLYHFLAFGWGFPLILTIGPATTGSYGDSGGWCWITDERPIDVAWRFIQFYGPLWIAMLYCAIVYARVARKFRMLNNGQDTGPVRRLKWYPLVLVICYSWASINRVYQAITGDFQFWLSAIHIIFMSSIGLLNAIVYGMTQQVKDEVFLMLGCYGARDSDMEMSSVA